VMVSATPELPVRSASKNKPIQEHTARDTHQLFCFPPTKGGRT
jgi:hypothetical protein